MTDKECREFVEQYYSRASRIGTPTAIIQRVARYFELSVTDIKTKCRERRYVVPRMICMYLIRTRTELSLKEVGRIMGGFDHTAVIHAVKTIHNLTYTDPTFKAKVDRIEQTVRTHDLPRPLPPCLPCLHQIHRPDVL